MTVPAPARPPRRTLPRPSLTMLTVVAVLIAGFLGAGWLDMHRAASERVVVLTRGLAAFQPVSAGEVSLRAMPPSAIPHGALRSLGAVRGHYVLQPVHTGQVVVRQAVGPPATATGLVVVPLPAANDSSARIRKGDLVDVLIAPRKQSGRAVVMRRVLVVDEQQTPAGDHLVYIAVPRHRERAIALAAGRGLTILAEVPKP
jgi:Flp pilus assembly protein CpaB